MAPIGRPKTTVMMDTDRITGELTALIWVRRSVIGVKHISGRQVLTTTLAWRLDGTSFLTK